MVGRSNLGSLFGNQEASIMQAGPHFVSRIWGRRRRWNNNHGSEFWNVLITGPFHQRSWNFDRRLPFSFWGVGGWDLISARLLGGFSCPRRLRKLRRRFFLGREWPRRLVGYSQMWNRITRTRFSLFLFSLRRFIRLGEGFIYGMKCCRSMELRREVFVTKSAILFKLILLVLIIYNMHSLKYCLRGLRWKEH